MKVKENRKIRPESKFDLLRKPVSTPVPLLAAKGPKRGWTACFSSDKRGKAIHAAQVYARLVTGGIRQPTPRFCCSLVAPRGTFSRRAHPSVRVVRIAHTPFGIRRSGVSCAPFSFRVDLYHFSPHSADRSGCQRSPSSVFCVRVVS